MRNRDHRQPNDLPIVQGQGQKAKGQDGMGVEYVVVVRDRNGKLISQTTGKGHSWVRNWIRILGQLFYNRIDTNELVSLTNTAGGSSNFVSANTAVYLKPPLTFNADAGVEVQGVRVGTSDTAFSKLDYELIARIVHGNASGQLLYGATTVEGYVETDAQAYVRIIRGFTNSSGATITVKEIGIAILNRSGTTNAYFLVCRDVLPSPQSVPDGAALTVRYKVYIAYA